MLDMAWLATEAQKLHAIFQGAFFMLVTVFLLLAIILDYFRIPLGGAPGFSTLVARCLIATMLLIAMPEIMNAVANITDAIAYEVGDLNNFKFVLSRMGDKLKTLSWSWTSVKDMVTLMISFLTFFILYISVYFADAAFLYTWTLIYVFSPIILALFVLPVTSGGTSAMFRSMIEVSLWKIVWASMAALLWSTALSDINKPEYHIDFLTAIVMNLMLALSVLMTPFLVRGLFSTGISGAASALQNMAMASAALTPVRVLGTARSAVQLPISKVTSRFRGGDDPKVANAKNKQPLRKSDPPPRPKK